MKIKFSTFLDFLRKKVLNFIFYGFIVLQLRTFTAKKYCRSLSNFARERQHNSYNTFLPMVACLCILSAPFLTSYQTDKARACVLCGFWSRTNRAVEIGADGLLFFDDPYEHA